MQLSISFNRGGSTNSGAGVSAPGSRREIVITIEASRGSRAQPEVEGAHRTVMERSIGGDFRTYFRGFLQGRTYRDLL